MPETAASVRANARSAMQAAIVASARRQLAEVGAASLSVRAVARDVGMASSAIYRYVKSRDELLTMLIIGGYDELGEVVEAAEATIGRTDLGGRFAATCWAARRWAIESPHLYALLYGSPVPGYVAPQDTIGPATRVTQVLVGILIDHVAAGAALEVELPEGGTGLEASVAEYLPGVSEGFARLGVQVWSELFGLISFELFGHFVGSVGDPEQFFEASIAEMARQLNLPAPVVVR